MLAALQGAWKAVVLGQQRAGSPGGTRGSDLQLSLIPGILQGLCQPSAVSSSWKPWGWPITVPCAHTTPHVGNSLGEPPGKAPRGRFRPRGQQGWTCPSSTGQSQCAHRCQVCVDVTLPSGTGLCLRGPPPSSVSTCHTKSGTGGFPNSSFPATAPDYLWHLES